MDLEHHPLIREFPEYREIIHKLKMKDSEFHDLMKRYDQIDKEIYRVEHDIEPRAEQYLEILKKKRIFFCDKIFEMITKEIQHTD